MKRLPLPLAAYRMISALLEPGAALLLRQRLARGKEDGTRIAERRGYPGVPRPDGPLIWLHGASVGETMSLTPLVERLLQRKLNVLVTSGTLTSAAVIARRLPPGIIHQFIPLDIPRYMRRFLDYWRPDLALVCESEIWPNMIVEAKRRDIPLVMVNGRMSERSFKRWHKLPRVSHALLSAFDLCLAQSQADGERLAQLGAPRVNIAGNLKYDVPPPPAAAGLLAVMDGLTAGRPVWVAASTHPGEDIEVMRAHIGLKSHLPKLLTIIVPRHPERGPEIEALARANGLDAARRAAGLMPDPQTDLYIGDTVGELGLFYRMTAVAFMGGSLVSHGGQNPIEPARLGCAVLHGPHVHNFVDVYGALQRAGGARQVEDVQALARGVLELLRDPAAARDMARAGAQAVASLGGAASRTMTAIEPLLTRMAIQARASAE